MVKTGNIHPGIGGDSGHKELTSGFAREGDSNLSAANWAKFLGFCQIMRFKFGKCGKLG